MQSWARDISAEDNGDDRGEVRGIQDTEPRMCAFSGDLKLVNSCAFSIGSG